MTLFLKKNTVKITETCTVSLKFITKYMKTVHNTKCCSE